jgi:hypothetical protein
VWSLDLDSRVNPDQQFAFWHLFFLKERGWRSNKKIRIVLPEKEDSCVSVLLLLIKGWFNSGVIKNSGSTEDVMAPWEGLELTLVVGMSSWRLEFVGIELTTGLFPLSPSEASSNIWKKWKRKFIFFI